MFRVRYVVAVLIGLAVGAAAGWMSGRGFEPAQQGAMTGAHIHHGAAPSRTPAPSPNRDSPSKRHSHRYLIPGPQQVQERIVRCLYESATWHQQVTCLRALLRMELASTRWLGSSPAEQRFRLVDPYLGLS